MSDYIVIDASVSLKWALADEDEVDKAIALRDHALEGYFTMVAPSLWLYEVTNGLVTAVRRGRMDQQTGKQVLVQLLALGVRIGDPEITSVYDHATYHGIASYDSAYLALADALSAPLWTGDRPFYNDTRNSADFVHWIGDYA
jgi:predicted nucleic acid-binding protein